MVEARGNIVDLRRWRDELQSPGSEAGDDTAPFALANALTSLRPNYHAGHPGKPERPRVMIAHPYPIVVAGICSVIEQAGQEIVGTCAAGADLLATFFASAPDIVVLASALYDADGDFLRVLKGCDRMAAVVVIGDGVSADRVDAYLEEGVGGVLAGSSDDALAACVAAVAAGKRWIDADFRERCADLAVRQSG